MQNRGLGLTHVLLLTSYGIIYARGYYLVSKMIKSEQLWAVAYGIFSALLIALIIAYMRVEFLLVWAGVAFLAAIIKAYIDGQRKSVDAFPSKGFTRKTDNILGFLLVVIGLVVGAIVSWQASKGNIATPWIIILLLVANILALLPLLLSISNGEPKRSVDN